MSRSSDNFGFDDGSDFGFDSNNTSSNRLSQRGTATNRSQAPGTMASTTNAGSSTNTSALSSSSPFDGNKDPRESTMAASMRTADWALTTLIAILYTLFVYKCAASFWPAEDDCATVVDPAEKSKCLDNAEKRGTWNYVVTLAGGCFGVLLALIILKLNWTSRAAALGIAYGGLFTLGCGVISNQHKLAKYPGAQVLILGVIMVLFVFLPRITNGLLFKPIESSSSSSSVAIEA